MAFAMNDSKKIGIGLTAAGCFFTFFGMLFFFDRGLISMGNLLFLAGVSMTIGPYPTVRFFLRPRNLRGSIFFFGGLVVVIFGWVIVGLLLEGYGFVLLFRGFLPTVLMFLKRVPYIGRVLDMPGVKSVINRVAPAQLPV